jgi:uncharacterized membrane protein YphA (DoxX/SURF4 family)
MTDHAGTVPAATPWRSLQKAGFRFASIYLLLYLFPLSSHVSSTLGFFGWRAVAVYEALWHRIVPWVGAHLLHLRYPITVFPEIAGGTDTTYDNVRALCFILIAALVTVVWSVIGRGRAADPRLHRWLRWYVRVVLACAMLSYGANKVIPAQMPSPTLTTLMQPFGDLTPYRLSWSFIGASPMYQVFAGSMEMLGGILLLIPGLTTLGALVSLGALGNVFMLDAGYGIPVKFWALHLGLCAGFLLAPDLGRLANLLVFNRVVAPRRRQPLFQGRWANRAAWAIQWALALYVTILMLSASATGTRAIRRLPVTTPLYGVWRVDEFAIDGQARPPLTTDSLRWERIIVTSPQTLTIETVDGRFSPYAVAHDTAKRTLRIKAVRTAGTSSPWWNEWSTGYANVTPQWGDATELTYRQPSPGAMIVEGRLNGSPIRVTLVKEEPRFVLKERTFSWVNDEFDFYNERPSH